MRFRIGTTLAAGTLGAALLAAGAPALAATSGSPSGSATATVTVAENITIAVNTASFTLAPNTPDPAAASFTVTTNDGSGYSVDLSAPDLYSGTLHIPASDLYYLTKDGTGGAVGSCTSGNGCDLSNTPAAFYSSSSPTSGSTFTQDWYASVAGSTPPGDYSTTLTYTAVGA